MTLATLMSWGRLLSSQKNLQFVPCEHTLKKFVKAAVHKVSLSFQVLHPLQQRFLNLINQENFAQISQEEAVKQEIVATLEALCGIAEATQIDNVVSLFSFLMDFLSSCIGLMEVRERREGEASLRKDSLYFVDLICDNIMIGMIWWDRFELKRQTNHTVGIVISKMNNTEMVVKLWSAFVTLSSKYLANRLSYILWSLTSCCCCSGLQQHARDDQPHHRGFCWSGSQTDLLPGRGEWHVFLCLTCRR